MLTIEVAISTIGEGIRDACAVPLAPQPAVTYLIIHQMPDDDGSGPDPSMTTLDRPDVRYFSFREKGLSRSRNRALELAQADILIPTDDDVRFFLEGLEAVRAEFERRPDMAILTAQMTDPSGKKLQNSYKPIAFRHTVRSSLRTASPEFAVRPDRLRRAGMSWNEEFGLGTRYPIGEENLFLMDAVRKGLECRYLPVRLAANPFGSGYRMDAQSGFARGALFGEMFGILSPLMIVVFAVRKRRSISGDLREFLKHGFRGLISRWRDRDPSRKLLGRAGFWTRDGLKVRNS